MGNQKNIKTTYEKYTKTPILNLLLQGFFNAIFLMDKREDKNVTQQQLSNYSHI